SISLTSLSTLAQVATTGDHDELGSTPNSLSDINTGEGSKLAGIAPGADVTLAAINGGLVVTGTGLTLSGGASIKSGYSAGSSGWAILGDGSVEFNDGIYRGDIIVQGGQLVAGGTVFLQDAFTNHGIVIGWGGTGNRVTYF